MVWAKSGELVIAVCGHEDEEELTRKFKTFILVSVVLETLLECFKAQFPRHSLTTAGFVSNFPLCALAVDELIVQVLMRANLEGIVNQTSAKAVLAALEGKYEQLD